jgi:hypothetical protein
MVANVSGTEPSSLSILPGVIRSFALSADVEVDGVGNMPIIVVYSTLSCVNWAFFGTRGPLKRSFHSRFKMPHTCQKRPNLHTNELNTTFFGSTSPLKVPNRLKSLKLA